MERTIFFDSVMILFIVFEASLRRQGVLWALGIGVATTPDGMASASLD